MPTVFRSPVVATTRFDATLPQIVLFGAHDVFFFSTPQPPPSVRPEDDVVLTRTPNGTARQVGAGFYAVSSYVSGVPP